jgi:hypothetical protein
VATERTNRQILTTNCHLSCFVTSLSHRAASPELSTCTSCLSDYCKRDNERTTCVCVKFCCKLGRKFTETFQLLNQAYGEDCMSQMQCYEWFKHFKEGRMLVGEDPRPG